MRGQPYHEHFNDSCTCIQPSRLGVWVFCTYWANALPRQSGLSLRAAQASRNMSKIGAWRLIDKR